MTVASLMPNTRVWLMKNVSVLTFHSVVQGISPTLKYWPHLFLPSLHLMRYLINSWKLLSENPQHPPSKSTTFFLLTPPLKIKKVQVPPFCQHWKFFRLLLQKKRGGGGGRGHYAFFSKNGLILHNFGLIK